VAQVIIINPIPSGWLRNGVVILVIIIRTRPDKKQIIIFLFSGSLFL